MEELIGRWVRQIKESNWSYTSVKGDCFEIVGISGTMLRVCVNKGRINSMDASRYGDLKEFELMPEGWRPGKPEPVNQYQIY